MDERIKEILEGGEANYLFPFYWQHGDHTEKIPKQIQTIYDSGCRAFCVESRPHHDFAGEDWWRDMDIILAEAKKRDMKVWLLDDDRCPTGHAAGQIAKKYPELQQWTVVEKHVDIVGPMLDASVITAETNSNQILLGAFAFRRYRDFDEICELDAIDLTTNIKNGFLYWDIPEGVWRIFFYYKSRQGIKPGYIDMLNADSVAVLVDAVYETHYAHYKDYFGNTFAGFFSDEPCFGNSFRYGQYDLMAGKREEGYPFPWNDNVFKMMRERLDYDPLPHLNLLWYDDDRNGDFQAEFRYAYMDAVTKLYSECFTKQFADWCRAHGVIYVGHVIEETCLSSGAGHYFRAMKWQDMSGIDIVLHQVMPGMDDFKHTSSGSTPPTGGQFYHYVLGKLGASLAHIEPSMKGRVMCEVLGAYGWAEDTTVMKYLMDFLLVRGINYFVPHAFDSFYPDPDCPPHFGIEGKDPSFEGFSALMKYSNKVAHLLSDATHICRLALYYDMDSQWSSRRGSAMRMETVAQKLYDAHLDFDIVPFDYLDPEKVSDGNLCLCDERFDCLIVPYADHIAEEILERFVVLESKGFKIIFVDAMPENAREAFEVLSLDGLASTLKERGFADVIVEDGFDRLRIYHCARNGKDIFMFANEEMFPVKTRVKLPCRGDYIRLDLANDLAVGGNSEDGSVVLDLLPKQSQIIAFDDNSGLEREYTFEETVEYAPEFSLELSDSEDPDRKYVSVGRFDSFFNVTKSDFKPDFAGKMRYTFTLDIEKMGRHILLDLGRVGHTASLSINGKDAGIRFCAPYSFDVTDLVTNGDNEITVTVGNTLVQKVRDRFSCNMLIAPSGLLGGITLKYAY